MLLSIVAAVTVILYALVICCTPNEITDVWWQLRLGDEIRINHRIPSIDTYSWTSFHRSIILHEWGSCLVFAEGFRHLGGWSGVWLVLAVVTIATLLSMYWIICQRKPGSPLLSLCLTIFGGHLCGTCFTPRPQIFTYLCLTLALGILLRLRANPSRLALMLVLMLIVQTIWANMHAAAPIFLLICGTYACGDAIQGCLDAKDQPISIKLILNRMFMPIVCAVVTIAGLIANPNGIGIYHIVADTVGNKIMPSIVSEWAPVDFHSTWGAVIDVYIVFIGFMIGATKVRRNAGDILTLAVLILAALDATRNVPILALCGTIIVAPYCESALTTIKERIWRSARSFSNPDEINAIATVTICFVFLFGLISQLSTNGYSARTRNWNNCVQNIFMISYQPEDACAFIESEHFPTSYHIYNNYDNGAFLIWRLRQFPVFMSSETFVYFGPVLKAYFDMEGLPYNWRQLLEPYQPDFVLTGTNDRQSHLFLNAPDWALVFVDGKLTDNSARPVNLIFVKRSYSSAELIRRCRLACPMVKAVANEGYSSAK